MSLVSIATLDLIDSLDDAPDSLAIDFHDSRIDDDAVLFSDRLDTLSLTIQTN